MKCGGAPTTHLDSTTDVTHREKAQLPNTELHSRERLKPDETFLRKLAVRWKEVSKTNIQCILNDNTKLDLGFKKKIIESNK